MGHPWLDRELHTFYYLQSGFWVLLEDLAINANKLTASHNSLYQSLLDYNTYKYHESWEHVCSS